MIQLTSANAAPARRRHWNSQRVNELGLLIVIALLYVIFSQVSTGFLSSPIEQNILRDAASLGIAAWGATLIIIAGEIDVSVGPMVAFISVVLSYLLQWQVPMIAAVPLSFVLGAALGSIAGVLRAYFNVPSFVATLGLWSALRGLALFFTNALPVTFDESPFLDVLNGEIAGIPAAAIVMLVLFAVFAFISLKTTYGRSVFAVGGNPNAALLAGIPVRRVLVILFATAGLLAAITGLLLTARLGSGNAGAASGLEFDHRHCVIGGRVAPAEAWSMLGQRVSSALLVITLMATTGPTSASTPFSRRWCAGRSS